MENSEKHKLDQDHITPTTGAEDKSEEAKKEFKGVIGGFRYFLKEFLDIRKETDRETTLQDIKDDIFFKGHTSWILVCSIFIASVGLNVNSTAVVIGAMLISPLMGPILGIGLAVATNDVDTLRRSLKNFGVMVGLSILTAFLFFEFFPLRDESSELLARTAPDIRDVLIAFFGGLALVIARAKKGTIASVIFGVAIATALMPPLCTVGFGLAIGNLSYAGGAMYLFIINSLFIGLATFLVLKLLRFPMVKYANSRKRRRIARIASLLAILVMIPALYTFYHVWQESRFMNQTQLFIEETARAYQFNNEGRFLSNLTTIDYNNGKEPRIELVFMGDETIPENIIDTWETRKNKYPQLKNATLRIVQDGRNEGGETLRYISELYESKKAELLNKDERIRILEEELARMSRGWASRLPFTQLSEEIKINYEDLATLGFSYEIVTDFNTIDTLPVFSVSWKPGTAGNEIEKNMEKLRAWLLLKLKDSTLKVVRAE